MKKFGSWAYVVMLAMLLIGPSALAAPTYTGPTGILGINVNGDGTVNFALVGNPTMCGSVSGGSTTNAEIVVMTSPPSGQMAVTSDGAKAMVSALIAAKLAGRRVVISAENSSTPYCRVVSVQIYYQ